MVRTERDREEKGWTYLDTSHLGLSGTNLASKKGRANKGEVREVERRVRSVSLATHQMKRT